MTAARALCGGAETGVTVARVEVAGCGVAADRGVVGGAEVGVAAPRTDPGGAESDGAESDGAESDGAESDGAESDGAESDGAEFDRAESGGAEFDRAESGGAEFDRAESGGAVREPLLGGAETGAVARWVGMCGIEALLTVAVPGGTAARAGLGGASASVVRASGAVVAGRERPLSVGAGAGVASSDGSSADAEAEPGWAAVVGSAAAEFGRDGARDTPADVDRPSPSEPAFAPEAPVGICALVAAPFPVRAGGASSESPTDAASGSAGDAGDAGDAGVPRAADDAGFRPPGAREDGEAGSAVVAVPESSFAAEAEDLSVIANSAASADPGATLKISEACFGSAGSASSSVRGDAEAE
ncbi:hypothetical protein [Cryptosporangium arvum]|uniref:hypothetical protein n=1 Tax=Cryptosporangium arvum TaxID=80871 RepID=UPI0012ED606E|nr:hypothetical protein [Cryptosporangium arvum]